MTEEKTTDSFWFQIIAAFCVGAVISIQIYGFMGRSNLKSVEIQDCRQQLYGQKVQK